MIEEIIANHFGLTVKQMMQKKRDSRYVQARQTAMYFYRLNTKLSLTEIGKIFNKNHATVLFSIKKVQDLMSVDKGYAAEIASININSNNLIEYYL